MDRFEVRHKEQIVHKYKENLPKEFLESESFHQLEKNLLLLIPNVREMIHQEERRVVKKIWGIEWKSLLCI